MGSVAAGVDDGLGGEEDGRGGAVVGGVGVAGEGEGASVLPDDALGDPEAKAGAAFAFGGEEGLEEVFADLRRDAGTVVGDLYDGSGFESSA